MCDSKELLVAFLYDEIDPAAKRTFEKHLATCAECRDELAELGATRAQIALWTPPDADLGFRIVRERGTAAAPAVRVSSPAWGLAAAALLVLAIGAAIANLDVRYGSDGLVVRTGWNHARPDAAARRERHAGRLEGAGGATRSASARSRTRHGVASAVVAGSERVGV